MHRLYGQFKARGEAGAALGGVAESEVDAEETLPGIGDGYSEETGHDQGPLRIHSQQIRDSARWEGAENTSAAAAAAAAAAVSPLLTGMARPFIFAPSH